MCVCWEGVFPPLRGCACLPGVGDFRKCALDYQDPVRLGGEEPVPHVYLGRVSLSRTSRLALVSVPMCVSVKVFVCFYFTDSILGMGGRREGNLCLIPLSGSRRCPKSTLTTGQGTLTHHSLS